MNNQPETTLSLEHELALIRCKDYLQKEPEKAMTIALMQLRFHLEMLEENERLSAENTRLKSISLPPFGTPSHGRLQAEYDDLRSEYLDVLIKNARLQKENQQLSQENHNFKQVIDALTKDDSLDSLTEDNILLPDFIEEVL